MENKEKLKVVKDFLKENHIAYKESYYHKRCNVKVPLFINTYGIAVHVGDSQAFYEKTKGNCYPIFIRDEDSEEKVLEKIQNTIIKSMTMQQKKYMKRKEG